MEKLNPNQEVFVHEYLANGFNATLAYRKAYPEASLDSCRKNATRLKNKPYIKAEISRLMDEMLGEKDEIAKKVLMKLAEVAFAPKDDEHFVPGHQLKAAELIQKQLGLQTQNVNAKVEQVVFVGEGSLED